MKFISGRSYFLGRPVEVSHVDIKEVVVKENRYPYIKRKYLMTKGEHVFFELLQKIVSDKYFIIPQVSLSKLVTVDHYEKLRKTYNNKIDRKSVDFVLFSKDYFSPVLIIELDDKTHERLDRKARDGFVDGVAQAAGIKIVHVKAAFSYDAAETANKLAISQLKPLPFK